MNERLAFTVYRSSDTYYRHLRLVSAHAGANVLVFAFAGGALECGMDSGSPVTPEYKSLLEFTGSIDSVTVEVSGELIRECEAEMRQIMARQ